MKKNEVKIGGVYMAKVTNKLVQVRIDAVSKYGGWTATSLASKKSVRIRSATKLRSVVDANAVTENGKSVKNAKTASKAGATPRSTSALAGDSTTRDQSVCPNCGATERDEDGDCVKCHEPKADGAKPATTDKSPKRKRLSGLDAAVMVLEETGVAMNVKEITDVAFAKGYWKPAGQTPSATLAAALTREIAKKGSQSRFRKSERGKFVLNR